MGDAQKREKIYKSPRRKLVRFFEKSRNQWKEKCREAKAGIRVLSNRVRFLEKGRERLKNQMRELRAELARMKSEERKREKEYEILKKKTEEAAVPEYAEEFDIAPFGHSYSVAHIFLFVSLVLSSATGFRGAARAIGIFTSFLRLPVSSPSWYSGRLWLLRLGYYKLTRPKAKAEKWVWIVDHTVQTGAEKCLVILGIPLSSLPCPERCVSHEDAEPIALLPVTKSDGEVVWQQLEQTAEVTGVPREIIADHGSDLKSGIDKFCRKHEETCFIYDIKHKTAAVLKCELGNDGEWSEFSRSASQTKKEIQQTPLAPLAPPSQRTKSRYMNTDILIKWGRNMLVFFEKQEREADKEYDPEKIEEKLGWVRGYEKQIGEWEELLRIVKTAESFVRKEGICNGTCRELRELPDFQAGTDRSEKIRRELSAFVAEEELKVRPGERLLGSSEVIESVFGKLKRMEQDQAKSGFTSLLLSVAAMVSVTTAEVVRKAVEKIPTKKVSEWCGKFLGKSVQAKRKEAFAPPQKTEQKQDRFQRAA